MTNQVYHFDRGQHERKRSNPPTLSRRRTVEVPTSRVDLSGIFIYVGLEPNSDYLSGLLPLDGGGHIPTDIWMRTPVEGIFAAGDIRQNSAAQLITSAGDGATAAIAARHYLEGGQWQVSS